MKDDFNKMYQEIGVAAVNAVNDRAGKLLLYCEVEDGAVAADLFYLNRDGVVRYRFAPESLQEIVYLFWERWAAQPGNREWGAMIYLIDGEKFSLDLIYPDQMNPEEDVTERRPIVVEKHFGNIEVDYSRPN